ncbi:hypothetical protein PFFCH_00196 [Plasmodium falciparum FCH/4]|uniref:Uncharacterized protein n=1 Tax=Plasmodium falciparum FCH/4 TaxID=1036724 RepID=A0A024VUE1_PLAFA|nr:hypothetical protein PFFCH_00196 [Plasmodium falciparum FCH/4]
MYLKNVYIYISSCFILFDLCFSFHLLKMKYKNHMNNMKSVTFFLRSPQIYRKRFKRSRIKNVSFKKKQKKPLFLFENLKKGFSFLGFWRNQYDQKYIDDVISNINNLTRIKQVTHKKKSNEFTKENIKQILLHCVFSKIDFKIINNLSYIIKHFQMSNITVHSILNQISEKVKEKKDAENYLALHLFLLKDENITLFSMMHIMDFFKSKQKVIECIRDIKKRIYEECVGDLIRKKIERYNLYCEKKKIKFHMKDAIKKMEINMKDDDLYFNYHYDELLRCFTMKLNIERNNKNIIRSNYDNINNDISIDKDMYMNNPIDVNINNISLDEKIKEQFENPDDENLKELKDTYEQFQLFNDNIIKYIEEDQPLYNINDNSNINDNNNNINTMKNEHKIKDTYNDDDDDDYDYEKEEDLVIQKNIDDYIYKNTIGMNKSLEEFKNQFIEQADIEFQNFLSNVNLDQHGRVKSNDENTKSTEHIKNKNTINKGYDTELIQNQMENNFIKKNIDNNISNDISNNEINIIKLKKLNQSDEDINLTSDLIYERLRTKVLWYIQKIEYLKFKYQYDIINEQYPIIKNEKTVLDLLNYGYKIVMSPDVDNSLFEKTKIDSIPNEKDKNNQMENQKNSKNYIIMFNVM